MLKAQSSRCHTNNLPPVEMGCCAGAQIPYFLTLRRNVPQQCEANCRCVSQPPHLQTLSHTHKYTLTTAFIGDNVEHNPNLTPYNQKRSSLILPMVQHAAATMQWQQLSWNACAKSMAEKSKWCSFVYGEVEEKIAQQPHLSVFYVTFSYYKSMTTKCTDEETLKTKK